MPAKAMTVDVSTCPVNNINPQHWREDGTCRCKKLFGIRGKEYLDDPNPENGWCCGEKDEIALFDTAEEARAWGLEEDWLMEDDDFAVAEYKGKQKKGGPAVHAEESSN